MQFFRKIMIGIDVRPLLQQIADHSELWNNQPELNKAKRDTALYGLDSIVLRRIPPWNAPPDFNWNDPAFGVLSSAQDIVFALMARIRGERLSNVVISRLDPGEEISAHIDQLPSGMKPVYQRYQIPLQSDPGVAFYCGDEQVHMVPGEAWWFNNQVLHSVVNRSQRQRIIMRADIRPFTL